MSFFAELALRFLLNFITILILVRYLYFSTTRRRDYFFSYIMISTIVFLLCFLLENVTLQIGFALGLFAIFGILRYRTSTIPVKEMTYLFMVIGVSVINALTSNDISYFILLFSNITVVLMAFILEKLWIVKSEARKTIVYDNLELIHRANKDRLISDLTERTGLHITRAEIGKIDFVKKTARIRIFYKDPERQNLEDDTEEDN